MKSFVAERDHLKIAGLTLRSRLILGTGKYSSFQVMREAHEASGTAMATVAVRRLPLNSRVGRIRPSVEGAGLAPAQESILDHIDRTKIALLPNTAACYTADDAVRTARLAEAAGLGKLVKLEVLGDPKTLLPDTLALLEATRVLVGEGFTVLPYTNDDPIMAKRLVEAGAAAVMPLAAPIGSGQGILNPLNILFVIEAVGGKVPVIVDAGVGTASDAAVAMELGADGVLMNTAIAEAQDPVAMARAMRLAVEAGRLAFLAGRMPKRPYASASTPQAGTITS